MLNLLIVALGWCCCSAWPAPSLQKEPRYFISLSSGTQKVKEDIARDCPECAKFGFLACGDPDVSYGKSFGRHFFQSAFGARAAGRRGFLLTAAMTSRRFASIVRRESHAAAQGLLKQEFGKARLILVEEEGLKVHVLPEPEKVDVMITPKLHQCLQDPAKIWGCCRAASCKDECCEKDLGSPDVRLFWANPDNPKQKFVFKFHQQQGNSFFYAQEGEERGPLFYCLTDGAAHWR